MTTATQMIDKERAERDARIFEMRMEEFFRRWSPDDPYEKAQFHSQLTSLVIQTYRDAQEPMLKQWSAALAAMPFMPPIMGSSR